MNEKQSIRHWQQWFLTRRMLEDLGIWAGVLAHTSKYPGSRSKQVYLSVWVQAGLHTNFQVSHSGLHSKTLSQDLKSKFKKKEIYDVLRSQI